jgi:hypothetical protein
VITCFLVNASSGGNPILCDNLNAMYNPARHLSQHAITMAIV